MVQDIIATLHGVLVHRCCAARNDVSPNVSADAVQLCHPSTVHAKSVTIVWALQRYHKGLICSLADTADSVAAGVSWSRYALFWQSCAVDELRVAVTFKQVS